MAAVTVIMRPKTKRAEIFQLNGETCHRVTMDVNGFTVQIVMYGDSPNLIVDIDNRTGAAVHIADLDDYIASVIGGGE